MFRKACGFVREGVYGFSGASVVSREGNQVQVNTTNGTAFKVAPGYLVTAAHAIHQNNDKSKPRHDIVELIRVPDIGSKMMKAAVIDEDLGRDLALLKLENDDNGMPLSLLTDEVTRGTSCGFLGFPLAKVHFKQDGNRHFDLHERFQGAYISGVFDFPVPDEVSRIYEIDSLMYPGSSGCPAFDVDGIVMGMQIASMMQKQSEGNHSERIAISLVVPSTQIVEFLKKNNVDVHNKVGV